MSRDRRSYGLVVPRLVVPSALVAAAFGLAVACGGPSDSNVTEAMAGSSNGGSAQGTGGLLATSGGSNGTTGGSQNSSGASNGGASNGGASSGGTVISLGGFISITGGSRGEAGSGGNRSGKECPPLAPTGPDCEPNGIVCDYDTQGCLCSAQGIFCSRIDPTCTGFQGIGGNPAFDASSAGQAGLVTARVVAPQSYVTCVCSADGWVCSSNIL